MILDRIEHLGRYGLPHAAELLAFWRALSGRPFPGGEVELCGRDLFARPGAYRTKPAAEGKFEAHRVYADVQCLLEGREVIEIAPAEALVPLGGYDAAGDCAFYAAERDISRHLLCPGAFAVFFPGEAHRPGCSPDAGPQDVRKVVFKLRMG